MPPPTGRESDKFMLRLPDGMRDRIAEAARHSGRSMNAEIIVRLDGSFEGPFSDMRAGALVEAIRELVVARHIDGFGPEVDEAFGRFMDEKKIDEAHNALDYIVTDWLVTHGYLAPDED